MPEISVIVPVYNVEKYLARSLKSVLAQTFEDIEIICVNDGSTDNSLKILKSFAAKDKRIKIINQKNQGLSAARNVGLSQASAKWVYFLDSDDALHPQTFEICLMLANQNDAELVCFGFEKSDGISFHPHIIDERKIVSKVTSTPLKYAFKNGKYRIAFNVWTKFYKREILKNISFINGIHFEDWPHTYAVLALNPKTVLINNVLYFYTINPTSISNQKSSPKQIEDFFECAKYVYETYKNLPTLQIIRRRLMPKVLCVQLRRCKKAPNDVRPLMLKAFQKELIYLKNNKMLSLSGCGIFKYLAYLKIINLTK